MKFTDKYLWSDRSDILTAWCSCISIKQAYDLAYKLTLYEGLLVGQSSGTLCSSGMLEIAKSIHKGLIVTAFSRFWV